MVGARNVAVKNTQGLWPNEVWHFISALKNQYRDF